MAFFLSNTRIDNLAPHLSFRATIVPT